MHAFRDSTGKTWEITINVGTVKRVKALLKDEAGKPVDLSRLLEDGFKSFAELLGDVTLFVDVLYVICKPQADKVGVSDLQFGESLGGDSLEHAADAFREELIDFFPVSKARNGLRKLMDKNREIGLKAVERAEKIVSETNADEAVEATVAKIATETGSLSSSPPTPAVSA